jgi:hypothetical protein
MRLNGKFVLVSPRAQITAAEMPLAAMIMQHVGDELDAAVFARHLRLSPEYVRKACSRQTIQARDGVEQPGVLDLKQLSAREGAPKTHLLMQELMVDFITESTSVFSGATRKTRRLLMSRTELLQRFFALLSQLLRAQAAAHPELSCTGHLAKQYTALQANTLATAEQKGFDEVREVEERLTRCRRDGGQAAECSGHPVLRLCRSLCTKMDRPVEGFNASTISSKETFWKVLEHRDYRGERPHAVPHPRLGARGRGCGGGRLTALCKLPATQPTRAAARPW